MRVLSLTPYVTLAALVGALACASNTARTDDPNETAAAQDTTMTEQDTLTGQNEAPPGYRGMEQDTTQLPEQTPTDTFLQNQGTGQPQDTAGYGGLERQDTTGQGQTGQTDTTTVDTTGTTGWQDTTGMTGDTSGMTGADTANQGSWEEQSGADSAQAGDTTGYGTSQESGDSINR